MIFLSLRWPPANLLPFEISLYERNKTKMTRIGISNKPLSEETFFLLIMWFYKSEKFSQHNPVKSIMATVLITVTSVFHAFDTLYYHKNTHESNDKCYILYILYLLKVW